VEQIIFKVITLISIYS